MIEFKSQASLKSIRTIHLALLAGILAFMFVSLMIVEEMTPFQFNTEDPVLLSLVVLSLVVIPTSIMFPNYYLKKNPPKEDLQSKITTYQTLLIIRAALCTGAAEFGIVVFMMSGNPMPLAIVIIAMLVLVSYYPSFENIQKIMNLSREELKELKN